MKYLIAELAFNEVGGFFVGWAALSLTNWGLAGLQTKLGKFPPLAIILVGGVAKTGATIG